MPGAAHLVDPVGGGDDLDGSRFAKFRLACRPPAGRPRDLTPRKGERGGPRGATVPAAELIVAAADAPRPLWTMKSLDGRGRSYALPCADHAGRNMTRFGRAPGDAHESERIGGRGGDGPAQSGGDGAVLGPVGKARNDMARGLGP